jgi:hypothetical protein
VPEEQREAAGVIEVGVGEQDGVELVGTGAAGQAILGLALAAALKHARIDEDGGSLAANEIGRPCDFAAGSAGEFDFHGCGSTVEWWVPELATTRD